MAYERELRDDVAARFWSHVDKSGGPQSCWEWKGGYSTARAGKGKPHSTFHPQPDKTTTAGRFAYFLANGSPGKSFVVQTCGNYKCVNPAHLALAMSHNKKRVWG